MPLTVALPLPCRPVLRSDWYHEMPNGLFGVWITNRSNPVLAGRPCTETRMVSLSDPGVMVTRPRACGKQDVIPGDACSPNENDSDPLLAALAPDAAATPMATAMVPAAAVMLSFAVADVSARRASDLV